MTLVSARSVTGELTVLAVRPERCQQTVKQVLASIAERLQASVTQVCTDRYDGSLNAVREGLPRARGVIDRFPIAPASWAGAEAWRTHELKRRKAALPQEEYAALKGTLGRVRRPWAELSPEARATLKIGGSRTPRP
jgi:transposase